MKRPAALRQKLKGMKTLPLIALIGGTVATAGLTGFGGLAAWTVTTQNNGSTFATGTVHHTNLAKVGGLGAGTSCTDASGVCGVIFTLAAAKPGSSTTGTVQITNTGSLASTFQLSLASATGGTLCASLNAQITDNETGNPNIYNLPLSTMTALNLKQSGGNTTWAQNDTGTYTFTVSLPNSSPNSDMGQSCTVAYTWTQTNS